MKRKPRMPTAMPTVESGTPVLASIFPTGRSSNDWISSATAGQGWDGAYGERARRPRQWHLHLGLFLGWELSQCPPVLTVGMPARRPRDPGSVGWLAFARVLVEVVLVEQAPALVMLLVLALELVLELVRALELVRVRALVLELVTVLVMALVLVRARARAQVMVVTFPQLVVLFLAAAFLQQLVVEAAAAATTAEAQMVGSQREDLV